MAWYFNVPVPEIICWMLNYKHSCTCACAEQYYNETRKCCPPFHSLVKIEIDSETQTLYDENFTLPNQTKYTRARVTNMRTYRVTQLFSKCELIRFYPKNNSTECRIIILRARSKVNVLCKLILMRKIFVFSWNNLHRYL